MYAKATIVQTASSGTPCSGYTIVGLTTDWNQLTAKPHYEKTVHIDVSLPLRERPAEVGDLPSHLHNFAAQHTAIWQDDWAEGDFTTLRRGDLELLHAAIAAAEQLPPLPPWCSEAAFVFHSGRTRWCGI